MSRIIKFVITWIFALLFIQGIFVAEGTAQTLRGKTILLVGDSMAEGVNPYLAKKAKASGAKYCQAYKRGTRLEYWEGFRLERALRECKPDYVFVLLGANHLDDRVSLMERNRQLTRFIRDEIEETGATLIWVGPPSWKKSTGIEDSIKRQVDNFYESRGIKFRRQPDGKHLTMSEYGRWTNMFWTWFKGVT